VRGVTIGSRAIGYESPTYVVAEACDNHLGDLAVAKEMVRQAKLAGADAVKFQHHLPEEEMLPDAPMSDNFDEPLFDFLKKHALTTQQHAELKEHCGEVGIQYLCTPFSLRAAEELNEMGVAAFKIGSGEMTDIPTLKGIAAFGKPMIVSTGMCTFEEVDRTYEALRGASVPLVLMNCVSEYPPVYEDLNLGNIELMIQRYPEAVIGHSDHTPDLYTSFAAVALGAKVVEKHIILDRSQPGPDQSVSINMHQLADLCEGVGKIEKSLGRRKEVQEKEVAIRRWAFRSIVTVRPIRQGEAITQDMIWSKRPGTGIPACRMPEVIGRLVKRDLPGNVMITWDDLEGN